MALHWLLLVLVSSLLWVTVAPSSPAALAEAAMVVEVVSEMDTGDTEAAVSEAFATHPDLAPRALVRTIARPTPLAAPPLLRPPRRG